MFPLLLIEIKKAVENPRPLDEKNRGQSAWSAHGRACRFSSQAQRADPAKNEEKAIESVCCDVLCSSHVLVKSRFPLS